ncbi:AbrB/MazE/SpoVT family DNA-binding domain-containing protein [Roseateles sp. L2-2]|uniref:AbrB/MazE/SpoVT family DNA-binding domain-containing protein n=1 Tax=Roseateles sp. L2-2 TaxID=3422597 RepID=UPI003D36F165
MPAPVAILSSRHRVELPKEIRDTLDWKPGEELKVVRHKDGIFIYKRITLEAACGVAKGANTDYDYRDRHDRF